MNKIFYLFSFLCIFALAIPATSQINTPAPSPSARVEQTVGLTDVVVEYSRPSIKGRDIFGGLVPYGERWRTGANAATKITFSDDVKVGGKELKKGSYAIITEPGQSEWTFNFHPYESSNWSGYEADAEEVVSVKAEAQEMPFSIESLMFAFDNLTNNSGVLHLLWDKTSVGFPISTNTDEMVEKSIEATMSGPQSNDYFAAASYYLAEEKNLEQAAEWVDMALEKGEERFWMLRTKALIHAKLGNKDKAIEAAKRSLELAKEAGNDDYIRMNEKSIKEWTM